MRYLTGFLAALLTSACVTTGDPPAREASPREAAATNLRLGSEYLQRGDRQRALQKLLRAVEQDPKLAPAHAYLGLAYEQLGQPEEAGRHYKTALRLDADDATVRNMYAVHLCRIGNIAEAEDNFLLAAGVPTYTTPETALTNAGVCLLKLPDLERAEDYFRRALDRNPRYPDALWQMAKLTHMLNRDFQTRAFLQRLTEVANLSPAALWIGVQVERNFGDERAAGEYARKLRLQYPESVEARLLMESQTDDGFF